MSNSVDLPLSCTVAGRTWLLFTFEYRTPDGVFTGYLHAIDVEHAAYMLSDLRESAVIQGQIVATGL